MLSLWPPQSLYPRYADEGRKPSGCYSGFLALDIAALQNPSTKVTPCSDNKTSKMTNGLAACRVNLMPRFGDVMDD